MKHQANILSLSICLAALLLFAGCRTKLEKSPQDLEDQRLTGEVIAPTASDGKLTVEQYERELKKKEQEFKKELEKLKLEGERISSVTRVVISEPYNLRIAGESIKFTATVWQGNVRAENQKVTWTVEPKGNATVGPNGQITPHVAGQFTITAISDIDGARSSHTLTVMNPKLVPQPPTTGGNKESTQVTDVGEWNSDPNGNWQYRVKPRLLGMDWAFGKIVTVRVAIGDDGVPTSAKATSGPPELHKIAEDTAKKWRFRKNLPKHVRNDYEIEFKF